MKLLLTLAFGLMALTINLVEGKDTCTEARNLPAAARQYNFGGKCYAFVEYPGAEYVRSRDNCRNYGGILATPKTNATNSFLKDRMGPNSHVWIGLRDSQEDGVYKWADGSAFDASVYDSFEHGPADPFLTQFSGPCVSMDSRGKWHAARCTNLLTGLTVLLNVERGYICQF